MTTHQSAPPPTCGQGLAQHAPLPATLAELMTSMADNLELHMAALDLVDHAARHEYDAYTSLVRQHRDIAARLARLSREMAGYRDLPMGRHDDKAMARPEVADAFQGLIERESQTLESLGSQLDAHRMMLGRIRS